MKNDSNFADNSHNIANMFNDYFASLFTRDVDKDVASNINNNTSDKVTAYCSSQTFNELTLTESKVLPAVKSLGPDKALEPDGIPGRILIATADQIAPSLYLLFNKSLQIGSIPDEGK